MSAETLRRPFLRLLLPCRLASAQVRCGEAQRAANDALLGRGGLRGLHRPHFASACSSTRPGWQTWHHPQGPWAPSRLLPLLPFCPPIAASDPCLPGVPLPLAALPTGAWLLRREWPAALIGTCATLARNMRHAACNPPSPPLHAGQPPCAFKTPTHTPFLRTLPTLQCTCRWRLRLRVERQAERQLRWLLHCQFSGYHALPLA